MIRHVIIIYGGGRGQMIEEPDIKGMNPVECFFKGREFERKRIAYMLDNLNAEKGNLCLFCDSKKYNAKVGIVHKKDCIMLKLRKDVKDEIHEWREMTQEEKTMEKARKRLDERFLNQAYYRLKKKVNESE